MTKVKTNNNFSCQTSNLNLFTNFSKLQSHHKIPEKYEFRHHLITRV